MVKLTKLGEGKITATGKLEKHEIKRLFDFCRSFDISAVNEASTPYMFDVRSAVIHWLEKETKTICSSLYCDQAKGIIKIELGDVEDWTHDVALEQWTEVINTALEALNYQKDVAE